MEENTTIKAYKDLLIDDLNASKLPYPDYLFNGDFAQSYLGQLFRDCVQLQELYES